MSVIVMGKFPLRLIAAIALFLMIFALRMFTNLDNNVIVSILLISIFLIIFTYVFKFEGPSLLKTFVILFSFIVLPVFVLFYLGFWNSFSNHLVAIILIAFVMLLGLLAIVTMIKLSIVEIEYDWIDEKWNVYSFIFSNFEALIFTTLTVFPFFFASLRKN